MTTQLATVQTPRVSLLAIMANKYSMEPEAFKATIKATVMPANATNEQMAAFLLVAHEYDLNPITKEIYAFPAKGGGVTPVVGIDGWINLAQRRTEFDGMEHEFSHDEKGACISCTCRIWRKDRSRPVVVTEFMDECARQTDPWRSHKRRMLRHKATIQAIRYAFGFAGIKDEDDAEVIYNEVVTDTRATVTDLNARLSAETKAIPAPSESDWPKPNTDGELVDVRGIAWIEQAHSTNKTTNADGTWRMKRGADSEMVRQLEEEALAAINATIPDEPTAESKPLEFERIKTGIETAADQQAIDEWFDYSREVVISKTQREELERVAIQRQGQWNA